MSETPTTRARGRPPCPERERAKAAGRKTYRTGRPCKSGHRSARYVKGSACLMCVRLRTEARGRWDKAEWRKLKKDFLERLPSFSEAFPPSDS